MVVCVSSSSPIFFPPSLFLSTVNVALDWPSFVYALWNFAVCGLVAVFWYAPPKLQQAYLVLIAVLMVSRATSDDRGRERRNHATSAHRRDCPQASVLTQLPEVATWILLAIIAVYDLFAVLCPRGPLKVLLDTAQQRNEAIPALLYSGAPARACRALRRNRRAPPPPPQRPCSS